MGWLPIALALAGFIFFVIIVNYNSIKTQEEAIILAFHNLCQTAKARHTLLINMKENAPKVGASSFLGSKLDLKRYAEYHSFVQQELQSIEESRLFLNVNQPATKENRKKLKSLQLLNHRQHINIRIFNRKVREYNTLTSSYPTVMVATATGHKQLKPYNLNS